MMRSPLVLPTGRRTPRPITWHAGMSSVDGVAENHQRSSTESFRPTAQQILQSRLNAIESQQMAAAAIREDSPPASPTSRTIRILQSLAAFAKQPLSPLSIARRDARSTSSNANDNASTRTTTSRETQPSPLQENGPRFLVPTTEPSARQMLQDVAADRAREFRLLRPKASYSQQDQERMDADAAAFQEVAGDASPNALYVWKHQSGLLTEISEFHGFCYSTPLNVRISICPVYDVEEERRRERRSPGNVVKVFQKDNMRNRWSKICVGSHSLAYQTPMIPFDRMLKLKFTNFLLSADSGDLLLEGSLFDESSQYIQYKSRSLTAYASVIYKDPITGILYALTSRKWPKHIRRCQYTRQSMLDHGTQQISAGVQMHPLEEYLYEQRKRGVYFIFRRLQRSNTRITLNERIAVGQGLHEWYELNQERTAPALAEQRQRLKGAKSYDSSIKHEPLEHVAGTCSSSEAVMEALKHTGVLAGDISSSQAHYSCSGYFEMRSIEFATVSGVARFQYDALAYIHRADGYSPRGRATIVGGGMHSLLSETGDV